MTGRNYLAWFSGTAMGVLNKDPSMYFVSIWQYPSVCHNFITLPVETTCTVPVCFQPLPALLISTTIPFLEASSKSRRYKALVCAVWHHALESVEYQNHPTSLQVAYSLQHPVLVWLKHGGCFKKNKKNPRSRSKSLLDSSTNPLISTILCPIHNIVTLGKNYFLLALATLNNHHRTFKHLK